MRQTINLYHAGLEPPRERFTALQALGAVGAVAVLLSALGLWLNLSTARALASTSSLTQASTSQRDALTAAGRHAALDDATARELQQLRQRETGERRLRSAVDTGEAGAGAGFSAELLALGRRAQSQVWITGLAFSRVDQSIELRGRSLDAARLPAYLEGLQQEPTFKGRAFAQLVMRSDAQDASGQALPYTEFVVRTHAANDAAAALASSVTGVRP